jgi:hypothetical protein
MKVPLLPSVASTAIPEVRWRSELTTSAIPP